MKLFTYLLLLTIIFCNNQQQKVVNSATKVFDVPTPKTRAAGKFAGQEL